MNMRPVTCALGLIALGGSLLVAPPAGATAGTATSAASGRLRVCMHGTTATVWADGPSSRQQRLTSGHCASWKVRVGTYQVSFQDVAETCEVAVEAAEVTRYKKTRDSEVLPVVTDVAKGKKTKVNFILTCNP